MIDLRIIGVTGGIGSGKSTVSRILRNLNAAVIDCDSVAKSVTSKGGKAFDELVSYFGNEILDENGDLGRKKLADIVFNDPVKLHALNSITHKYVKAKVLENIESIKQAGKSDVIVLDCPLPVESGFLDLAEEVWVVVADRDVRIKRIMERNNFTYEEAVSRINSQRRTRIIHV